LGLYNFPMKVYKKIKLVGISDKSVEDAINNAIAKAAETLRGLSWFEVKEVRGSVENGKVKEFQVVLEVAFEVE